MDTGLALAEKIGNDHAQTVCLTLGLSTRWMRRSRAFELFSANLTVKQVQERMSLPKSTAYFFHSEWQQSKRTPAK